MKKFLSQQKKYKNKKLKKFKRPKRYKRKKSKKKKKQVSLSLSTNADIVRNRSNVSNGKEKKFTKTKEDNE